MSGMHIEAPEPRKELINVRVTENVKKYVEDLSGKHGISESMAVSQIIDQYRKRAAVDSNKRKPKRSH